MACALLGLDTPRRTPEAAASAKWLADAPPLGPLFGNISTRADFLRFVRRESFASEIGRVRYVTFVFVLRIQSMVAPLHRAFPHGPILAHTPSARKSLLALRRLRGEQRMALKIDFRKNRKRATIPMRPRLCCPNAWAPWHMFPTHAFWAAALQFTAPGTHCSYFGRRDANRILRKSRPRAGIQRVASYSAHALRRGSADELLTRLPSMSLLFELAGGSLVDIRLITTSASRRGIPPGLSFRATPLLPQPHDPHRPRRLPCRLTTPIGRPESMYTM